LSKFRIKKIKEWLLAKGIDSCLVTNLVNIQYLTGFTGSAGTCLISPGRVFLITDSRYTIQACQQASDVEVYEYTKSLEGLEAILVDIRPEKLAYEAETVSLSFYKKLATLLKKIGKIRPVATRNVVENLRRIKDTREIKQICRAVKAAEDAFTEIRQMIRPGVKERDLALELEYQMKRHGARKAAFDTIVASGPRSALPHAIASDRIIKERELLVIDFGCQLDGYHSDMTRTFIIGKGRTQQKKIYNIVREAQQRSLALIREGITAQEVDGGARDFIDSCGYGSAFGHGTGHGIGLEVHESPRINKDNRTVLKTGHTFTVEPGIYLKDIGGIRIEDMVTVTEDGCRILTSLPREPAAIDC
jgi:Xaa-Pro aminopeptidase